MTKIFHPNVAVPSGEICVNTLKKDWNPTSWSLSHIFEVVKCLLIVPFPESSLNEEVSKTSSLEISLMIRQVENSWRIMTISLTMRDFTHKYTRDPLKLRQK
jgi:ubiquitin-protein ligase